MKKLLTLITLILGFISMSFASYTPTQKETQTLELIKSKLESLAKSDSTKTANFKTQLTSLKEKHSNNERANYILDYLLNALENSEKDNVGVVENNGNISILSVLDTFYDQNWDYIVTSSGKTFGPYIRTIRLSNGYIGFYPTENSDLYFINNDGKKVGPYLYNDMNDFSEGYATVQKYDGEHNIVGKYYVDTSFKEVAGPYNDASNFSGGYGAIQKNDGKRYVIDTSFKEVAGPFDYDKIYEFSNGYAKIQQDNLIYYINKEFEKVGGPYNDASNFLSGYSYIKKNDGKWYIINKDFEEVAGPFDLINSFNEGYAVVQKNDSMYYIDETFKEVAGPYVTIASHSNSPYNHSYDFFSGGYAIILKSDSKWYLINKKFEEVGGPYNEIFNFSESYIAIQKNDGWHILNTDLKEVAGPFLSIDIFGEGYSYIQKNDGYGYYILDKNFREIAGPFSVIGDSNNGHTAVQKDDGKRYILDKNFKDISGALDIK